MISLGPTRNRWILLALAASTFALLAVQTARTPEPTRVDLFVDAWLRSTGPHDAWGDEFDELLIDYTLILLFDSALVVAAWRFGGPGSALTVAGALGLQEAIIRSTKEWTGRARPEGAYSVSGAFPSGHVANLALSILLFLLIVLPLLRRQGRFRGRLPGEAAYAVALIVTYALYRVFAGEHWITDVVGGLALALACALGAERVHAGMQTEKP